MFSIFTKEIWKPSCPCHTIHFKFTLSFSEETFSEANNKIFRIGDSQGFLLFCTQKLRDSKFYVVEDQGEGGWGGQVESFLPVQNLQNTEMVPGAKASSIHPFSFSASPRYSSPTAPTCTVAMSPGGESRTGRSKFKRCFYHLFVKLLINILCQKSLVQQKCNFCMNVSVSVKHYLQKISSDTISGARYCI